MLQDERLNLSNELEVADNDKGGRQTGMGGMFCGLDLMLISRISYSRLSTQEFPCNSDSMNGSEATVAVHNRSEGFEFVSHAFLGET